MNFKIHDEGNTTNLKANEMGDKLKEVSEKPDFQSLLVFIMSHGAAGQVLGETGELAKLDIRNQFNIGPLENLEKLA